MPEAPPANPFLGSWRWLGYQANRFESVALVSSGLLLAGGGLVGTNALGISIPMLVVGTVVPAAATAWKRREEADEETSDARAVLLEQSLRPLLELAATTTSQPRAERLRTARSAAERVVIELANAFGDVPGVRVVVFRVTDDGSAMEPGQPAGRQDRPRAFARGTPRGEKAFEVLQGSRPFVRVPDLADADPAEWQGTGNGYQTFISAPIRSSEDGLGLLTVDAPVADSLEERHGATLALFAAALGVLFAEAVRGGGGAS